MREINYAIKNTGRICVIIAASVLVTFIGTLKTEANGPFVLTGCLAVSRANHCAVLLPNGRVLVAGGHPQNINCASTASAEIYDPVSETWSQTASMNRTRYDFTLTLLPNGKALAVGGAICGGGVNNTAELYDPSTRTWQYTGNLAYHRSSHAAVLLTTGPNAGKVLVIAGSDSSGYAVNTAELYDPTTGTWATTGSLTGARMIPQAVVLNDGRVLVAGGQIPNVMNLNTAELYDPVNGTWTPTGNLNVAHDGFHTITLLPNGEVLVIGGLVASVERYNPANGLWNLVAPMSQVRGGHTASLLSTGNVLVAGGVFSVTFYQSAEIYDWVTDTWSPAGNLNIARTGHTATTLQNGQILFASGGTQYAVNTASAELYSTSNQPPNAICRNITKPADENCQAAVTAQEIDDGSTDSEGGNVTLGLNPSGPFPLGTSTVTLIVTDSAGASATCTATVTVVDTQAPTISGVSATPSVLWPPNHQMVNVTVNYSASDNCGAVNCSLSVMSNEPVNGTGDGDTGPDWEIIDAHYVKLRAERGSTGNGRIYTITITCTDDAGNTTSQSVTVTVPKYYN